MKTARTKIMDLLARRGHSELELRQKLARAYPEAEVEDAITHAKQNKWMPDPTDLTDAYVESLTRKLKSFAFIEESLRAKGLSGVSFDAEIEIEKARKIAQTKLVGTANSLDDDRAFTVRRLLASRGFDEDTVEKVIESFTVLY